MIDECIFEMKNQNLKNENDLYNHKKFLNKKKRFNIYNYDNYGKEYSKNEKGCNMESI